MSITPMQQARAALALHPRCEAHCRTTGQPCKNAEMSNGRCRMHGGKSRAVCGEKHYNYRHGARTGEARHHRRQVRVQIKMLRELMRG
jgi:hypothetical protein